MTLSPSLRRWSVALSLLFALLLAGFLWVRPLLNIGAGYAAKHACSCHFLQGRGLDDVRRHDLNFSVLGWVSLAVADDGVDASFLGLTPRRAVYRPGVGCTLLNAADQPLAEVAAAIPFSGADAGAGQGQSAVVVGPPALREALAFGMQPVPGGGARGLVVLHGGRLIAERYAPGYGPGTPLLGWSMTKTLTALTLGYQLQRSAGGDTVDVARAVGRDHLFPLVWTDSARQAITVADLLHMNSGLAWNEAYGSLSDATIMLHEHADMAAYARAAPAVAPAGEVWNYSSGTTNILAGLIDAADDATNFSGLYRALFRDVAPSLLIEPSQAGLPVGSSYGWATARDWARLGQFMLQDGVWNGDTLLPPGWVDYLTRPAAGSDGTYGGQTWLPGPDTPSLPAGSYMMRGFQDQRVFIVPGRDLVLVRLGHNDDKAADFDRLIAAVLAAVPTD